MWFGVMAMAYSLLLTNLTGMIINSWPNKKLLNYSFKEQMIDIFPTISMAIIMGVAISVVGFLRLPDFLTLIIQVPCGAFIYIVSSKILHLDSFEYLLQIVKSFIEKK